MKSGMRVIRSQWVSEGAGAKVLRVLGNGERLDPFIMLDLFKGKLPGGFPDHPHRGFQTISYILQGAILHEDCHGHRGRIGPGDVQWMTAGRGIIHSEMPASDTQVTFGFQLWLNLHSSDKMKPAQYQQFTADKFPVYQDKHIKVKVLAGQYKGKKSPIVVKTDVTYFDVQLQAKGNQIFNFNEDYQTIVFVYKGDLKIDGQSVKQMEGGLFQGSTPKHIEISSKEGCKFIMLSGKPIKQPIAQYGPFVMNTKAQIEATIRDYQQGRNGFQNNRWTSQIRKLAKDPKRHIKL